MEFAVGDHRFMKVSPHKGAIHFGRKGKLAPRFIGPFEVLQGLVRLRIDLDYLHRWSVCMMYSM